MTPIPAYIRDAISAYRSALEARFGGRLEKVALFGSRARGEGREDSDIDVIVWIREATSAEELEAVGLAGDVAVSTTVWLSAKAYSSERFRRLIELESPFARSVLADHVLV